MTIPSWAVKGAKVVCVMTPTDIEAGLEPPGAPPVEGAIYTIELAFEDGPVVYLHLVDMPHEYIIYLFRPLVTRSQEQDVEMFHKISDGMTLTERLDRIKEALDA